MVEEVIFPALECVCNNDDNDGDGEGMDGDDAEAIEIVWFVVDGGVVVVVGGVGRIVVTLHKYRV